MIHNIAGPIIVASNVFSQKLTGKKSNTYEFIWVQMLVCVQRLVYAV